MYTLLLCWCSGMPQGSGSINSPEILPSNCWSFWERMKRDEIKYLHNEELMEVTIWILVLH